MDDVALTFEQAELALRAGDDVRWADWPEDDFLRCVQGTPPAVVGYDSIAYSPSAEELAGAQWGVCRGALKPRFVDQQVSVQPSGWRTWASPAFAVPLYVDAARVALTLFANSSTNTVTFAVQRRTATGWQVIEAVDVHGSTVELEVVLHENNGQDVYRYLLVASAALRCTVLDDF